MNIGGTLELFGAFLGSETVLKREDLGIRNLPADLSFQESVVSKQFCQERTFASWGRKSGQNASKLTLPF